MMYVLLIIFAGMMGVATLFHAFSIIRRQRHLRSMHRAIADAGKKAFEEGGKKKE